MDAGTPERPAEGRRRRRRASSRAELVEGVLGGDRRLVARTISLVEDGDPVAREVVADLWPHARRAATLGITGPPGVGKSSLIAGLVAHLRGLGKTVGVISVDPSSHLTRGALLGDRIRLADHFLDPGVYIRSMGTRGHLGGVAEATLQAGLIVSASGKDVVIYETVGVGQSEVEISALADTVALVLMPGSGDSIQALKAGIMEIPDLIVVNKADHPATNALRTELRQVLGLGERRPPVLETQALEGAGIPELWAAVEEHRRGLEADGGLERQRGEQLAREVVALAAARAERHLARAVHDDPRLAAVLEAVQRGDLDPLSAVEQVLEGVYGIER